MYCVYVIKSECGRYYIGSTNDLKNRLHLHNTKKYRGWTNRYSGWKIVYLENFDNRKEALIREKVIKSMKGGNEFKKLICAHNPA